MQSRPTPTAGMPMSNCDLDNDNFFDFKPVGVLPAAFIPHKTRLEPLNTYFQQPAFD